MRVRRVLVNDFIKIEEPRTRNTLLAKGLKSIATVVGEEPGRADRNCFWSSGDLGGRVLLQRGAELSGCDEVGGE